MKPSPNIHIVRDDVEKTLEGFTEKTRVFGGSVWRCLYADMSADVEKQPDKKYKIPRLLKDFFSEADHAEIFWLPSGKLFVFFQGPVRAVIREFDEFLFDVAGQNKSDKNAYHFFWELDHFWGYFDEILVNIFEGCDVQDIVVCHRKHRHKPLLLILEDDRVTRHLLETMMNKHCDIVVAWNAVQAEKLYKDLRPNIAFLDVQVPFGDGEDLAATLCEYDPEAFIVIVSGALNPAREKRCFEAGVKGCVHKPPEEEKLVAFLKTYHQEQKDQQTIQTAST